MGLRSQAVTDTDASGDSRKQKRETILTLSLLLHASLFGYWVFAHVHESSLLAFAESATKLPFPKLLQYPGRWQFLTFVNMWVQLIFFCISLFGHCLPNGIVRRMHIKIIDVMFATVVFPTAFVIFSVFWPIYLLDSNSIYPSFFAKVVPPYLNHIYHTSIVLTAILELFTVCHYYPGTLLGFFMMGSFNLAYLSVMISSVFLLGRWPYGFMDRLSPFGLMMFFGISFLLYIAMFYIGKMLNHLRWGERLRHVKED